MRIALIAAVLLLTASSGSTAPANQFALSRQIDRVIDNALAEGRIVGAAVLVMHDGELIYHRAAGFIDREKNASMPENTIFRLASSSKAIVSATAIALIDQGILSLDDPVTTWLPDFTPRAPDGSTPPILVRQLLTHTSGISYPFWEKQDGPYRLARVSSGFDQPGLSMEEELRRIKTAGLEFLPGSSWRYSLSIDVLGAIIAKATGIPLPDAVRDLVTGPLGMTDTGFVVTERRRLAVPYFNASPKPKQMSEPQDVDFGEGIYLSFSWIGLWIWRRSRDGCGRREYATSGHLVMEWCLRQQLVHRPPKSAHCCRVH